MGPQQGWADTAALCGSVTAQLRSPGVTCRLQWDLCLLQGRDGGQAGGHSKDGLS